MSADGNADDIGRRLAFFGAVHPGTALSSRSSRKPPGLVIRVSGMLDTANSPAFQNAVSECLGDAKARGGLILDLEGLSYASSTGVGALTALLIEAQRHRIAFYLSRVPHNVSVILDLLGFSAFFERVDRYEADE